MWIEVLLCLVGFALLYFGAEWLVNGSSSLAQSLGISPVVIGLTVVAFGTSSPEMVVSLVSSIKGNSMIAVGNVIGSNICNIALILGATATLQPIVSHPSVIRRDIPIMLGISTLLLIFSWNAVIGRMEGAILLAGIIAYTLFNYRMSVRAKDSAPNGSAADIKPGHFIDSRVRQVVFIVLGIAGVIGGAELVVHAAVIIMKHFGVGEKFIGLTIVAFGTSLPELATSVVAALRGEMDISLGNLVGSNVFNIMSVLGAASLVRPIPIPGGFLESGLWIDYLVMMATSAMPFFMMRNNNTIHRGQGLFLLSCYVGYVIFLTLKATG